jgi:hypothetical protein
VASQIIVLQPNDMPLIERARNKFVDFYRFLHTPNQYFFVFHWEDSSFVLCRMWGTIPNVLERKGTQSDIWKIVSQIIVL